MTDSLTTPADLYRHISRERPDLIGAVSEYAFRHALDVLNAQGVFVQEPGEAWCFEELMIAVEEVVRDVEDR